MRAWLSPVVIALSVTLPAPAAAQTARPAGQKPDPAFAPVKDDPKLPRVLLIGDSISVGYTLPTRELLQGEANVHRIPENGGPTTNGLKKINAWLAPGRWSVIHFNWGLHDLKLDTQGKPQVSLQEYERNLRRLVQRLKATRAKLIWASTTPVPEGKVNPPRKDADVVAYNRVARKVMEENGVPINDLYAAVKPDLAKLQHPVNVHFNAAGSRALAEEVAARIREELKKK